MQTPPSKSRSQTPSSRRVGSGNETNRVGWSVRSECSVRSGCSAPMDARIDKIRAFSPSMNPSELSQWLLGIYGEAYQDDIQKLKRQKINGELFLELDDDEEFLKELNLSFAFWRLLKKTAKELKWTQLPSNGQASRATAAQTATVRELSATAQAQTQPTIVFKVLKSTDRLHPDLLNQVLDVMWPARTEATGIGLALGLAPDDVNVIERTNNYRVNDFFTEMMRKAMMQGLVTQQKLADAVSSKQIGFGYLSEEILAKRFTIIETPQSAAVPVHVTTPGHGASMPAAADADFDPLEVKNHLVSRMKWIDTATGETKIVRVYNRAAWRWRNIADNIGLEPGEIQGIQRNNHDDNKRVTDVFLRWLDDANNLPNKNRYPKKWSGLIRLLKDSDLGRLSEDVKEALSAPDSNIRGTLYGFYCSGGESKSAQHFALSMDLLKNLRTKIGQTINIIEQVAAYWHMIARCFRFKESVIAGIEAKNRYSHQAGCEEMMEMWIFGKGRQPATWKLLVNVIRECGLEELAQQVEEAVK